MMQRVKSPWKVNSYTTFAEFAVGKCSSCTAVHKTNTRLFSSGICDVWVLKKLSRNFCSHVTVMRQSLRPKWTHTRTHLHTQTEKGRQGRSSDPSPRSSPAAIWAWITCKDLGEDFAKLIATGLKGGKLPLHNCVKGVGEKKTALLGSQLDLYNICGVCVCVFERERESKCTFSNTLPPPPPPSAADSTQCHLPISH